MNQAQVEEIFRRMMNSEMEIVGDNKQLKVSGSGTRWIVSFDRPLVLSSAIPSSSSDASPALAQFAILTRTISDVLNWGVFHYSQILNGYVIDDLLTIDDLLEFDPDDSDAGWKPISGDDRIWIEGTFGEWPALDSISVQSLGGGGDFGGGIIEYESDGEDPPAFPQKYFRLPVAQAFDQGADPPIIVPYFTGARVLILDVLTGYDSGGATPKETAVMFPFAI